jgi:hypothetical protein
MQDEDGGRGRVVRRNTSDAVEVGRKEMGYCHGLVPPFITFSCLSSFAPLCIP